MIAFFMDVSPMRTIADTSGNVSKIPYGPIKTTPLIC
jgi:hypothetical protein